MYCTSFHFFSSLSTCCILQFPGLPLNPAAMAKLLQDCKVLLTGASRGLGRELACTFAREGAYLILCSEAASREALEQASPGRESVQGFTLTTPGCCPPSGALS